MKNNLCTFYIVRHGETGWNAQKKVQGHTDIPLNKEGENQAKSLAEKLSKTTFDLVFSSDLLRAKRTAQIITLEKQLAIQTTEALREIRWGNFEGKRWEVLDAFEETLAGLSEEEISKKMKENGAETPEELVSRLLTFLREASVANPGKTILIATHGRAMSTLLKHLGFWEEGKKPHKSVSNGAVVKLESDGVDFFIRKTKGVKK